MSRHAYCTFCDDIRYELGNKTTLIGIYNGELFVPSLPAVLPKLCIATFISTPIDSPLASLSMQVWQNDQLIQEIVLPESDLSENQANMSVKGSKEDPVESIIIGGNIMLSPFSFDKEGSISIRMIADGKEYKAGKLRLRVMPNQ